MTTTETNIRRELVTEFEYNYLVEAGAGAGKTYTMIQRIVNQLVSGSCEPEHLVAITFTNKSTQEMRERLDSELRAYRKQEGEKQDPDPALLARLDDLIAKAGRMQISTIHSFCQTMLETMPFYSPLGMEMKVLEGDESLCRSFFNRRYREDPGRFARVRDDFGVSYAVLEDNFLACCHNGGVKLAVEPITRDMTAAVNRLLPELHKQLHDILKPHEGHSDLECLDPELVSVAMMEEDDFKQDQQARDALSRLVLWSPKLPVVKYDEEIEQRIKEIKKASSHPYWNRLVGTWDTDELRDLLARTVHTFTMDLLVGLKEEYKNYKLDNGIAIFDDLLIYTRDMLRDPSCAPALEYFHNQYQVIYVDEFQDTDPVQTEMLFYLTAEPSSVDYQNWCSCIPVPGSLFLVGDPKQAIYRFRGAGIDVYNRVKELFDRPRPDGSPVGKCCQLNCNFRSSTEICDWSTKFFSPPMGLSEDERAEYFNRPDARQGDPDYDPKQANYAAMDADQGKVDGSMVLGYRSPDKKKSDPRQVAAFIKTLHEKKFQVWEDKTVEEDGVRKKVRVSRAVCWSDFLILKRTTTDIGLYVRELSKLDIPVQVSGRQKLQAIEPIRRFTLYLRALREPREDIFWTELLQDCWGVSLPVLRQLLQRTGGSGLHLFLYPDPLRKLREGLDDGADTQLLALCGILEQLSKLLDRVRTCPAMSVMEELFEGNYGLWPDNRNLLSRQKDYGWVELYLNKLRGYENHSFGALSEYALEWAEGSMEHELSLTAQEDQVRIMNLHKAKGLQGKIVILTGGSNKSFPPERYVDRSGAEEVQHTALFKEAGFGNKTFFGWTEKWNQLGLDLNSRPCFCNEEKEFQNAEEVRLRYVAATRGAYMLVICGKKELDDREKELKKALKDTYLEKFEKKVEKEKEKETKYKAEAEEKFYAHQGACSDPKPNQKKIDKTKISWDKAEEKLKERQEKLKQAEKELEEAVELRKEAKRQEKWLFPGATTAWQHMVDHNNLPWAHQLRVNAQDPILKAAMESLCSGEFDAGAQKTAAGQQTGVTVDPSTLDSALEQMVQGCTRREAYPITPSKLDHASRTVQRKQDKLGEDTEDESPVSADGEEKAETEQVRPSVFSPKGADWGTVIHRVMELAVLDGTYEREKRLSMAQQAVEEVLPGGILTTGQKIFLLPPDRQDMEPREAAAYIAARAAEQSEFMFDPGSPLRQRMEKGKCYPELPFILREEDRDSELYRHLSSHIRDEAAKDKALDIQGIIDLAIYDEKEQLWTVVDYKTDRIREYEQEDLSKFRDRLREEYTAQIASYAKVLERLGMGAVAGAALCSVPLGGDLIELDIGGKGLPKAGERPASPTPPPPLSPPVPQQTEEKKFCEGGAAGELLSGGRFFPGIRDCTSARAFALLLDGVPVVLTDDRGQQVTHFDVLRKFSRGVTRWLEAQVPEGDCSVNDANAGNVALMKRTLKTMKKVLPGELWSRLSISWEKK